MSFKQIIFFVGLVLPVVAVIFMTWHIYEPVFTNCRAYLKFSHFNVSVCKNEFQRRISFVRVRFFITLLHFFYKNNFIRTKALILAKKIKNKLRTKPGLLSHRT